MAKGDKAGGGGQATKERAQAAVAPAETMFGESEAQVHVENEAEVLELMKDLFGEKATLQDLASVIGAPDGAEVWASASHGKLVVTMEGGGVGEAYRTIQRTKGGVVIHNNLFFAEASGGGVGIRVFGKQVAQAARLGVSRIETNAARGPDMNGYYTWARFGYDAPLPSHYRPDLPPGLKGSKRVSDLMQTEAGQKWWKTHGDTIDMTFDLKAGSTSRKTLDKYLKSKGLK